MCEVNAFSGQHAAFYEFDIESMDSDIFHEGYSPRVYIEGCYKIWMCNLILSQVKVLLWHRKYR